MRLESMHRTFAPLALAAVIAACGGDAGDTEATTPPPAASQPGDAAAATSAMDDYLNYRLTMPAVQRWYEAQTNVYRAMGDDPELAEELAAMEDARDMSELEAHFDGIPEVRAAVRQAGLDMGEYAAILLTLYHARGVDAAIQSGADRAQTIANREVNPSNLEFVEQNRSELDRMERELEELEESMQ